MLKLRRYPLGTPLFVRPEKIAAISEYRVGNAEACVVHIENDAREAVWGTAEDLNLCLGYVGRLSEGRAQAAYDGRMLMLLQIAKEETNASAAETK